MPDNLDKLCTYPDDELLDIVLSAAEQSKLKCRPGVSEFQRDNLEKNAKKNWDLFYKRNGSKFFRRRYWTRREFDELFNERQAEKKVRYLLEVGCGCGDFALTLLDNEPDKYEDDSYSNVVLPDDLFIYCCDISESAIKVLKSTDIYKRFETSRIKAFVGNILDQSVIVPNLDANKMDYISLIFVLSALDPDKMQSALNNIRDISQPGGLVFFRDYAVYDKAMLRFSEKAKISDRFYVRQDGTRAYFFTKTELANLFEKSDFDCESIEYVQRETVNNATHNRMSRIFIQAKFRRRST